MVRACFIRSLSALEIIHYLFLCNNPGFLGDGDRRFLAIDGPLRPRENPHFRNLLRFLDLGK